MIQIKQIAKPNPFDSENPVYYYASAVHSGKLTIEDLATEVAERCSLRCSDVIGALIALMDVIPENLIKGKVVTLGELGSFYLTVKSEGVKNPDELTKGMVKGVKIQYRPTKKFKNKLKIIDVSFKS